MPLVRLTLVNFNTSLLYNVRKRNEQGRKWQELFQGLQLLTLTVTIRLGILR